MVEIESFLKSKIETFPPRRSYTNHDMFVAWNNQRMTNHDPPKKVKSWKFVKWIRYSSKSRKNAHQFVSFRRYSKCGQTCGLCQWSGARRQLEWLHGAAVSKLWHDATFRHQPASVNEGGNYLVKLSLVSLKKVLKPLNWRWWARLGRPAWRWIRLFRKQRRGRKSHRRCCRGWHLTPITPDRLTSWSSSIGTLCCFFHCRLCNFSDNDARASLV